MENKFITSSMIQLYYQDQGYVIIERAIAPDVCSQLIQQAEKLVADFKATPQKANMFSSSNPDYSNSLDFVGKLNFFLDEMALINKISCSLHTLDPVFKQFSMSFEIDRILKMLGKNGTQIIQSMYIFKQAHWGEPVVFHQDATYLHASPSPVFALWIALEDAAIDNGCLWVLPGKHNEALRSRFIRTSDGLTMDVYDPSPWPEDKAVPLEVEAGSVVALHGHLPHGSYANRSSRSRQAFSLHFLERDSQLQETCWLHVNEDNAMIIK